MALGRNIKRLREAKGLTQGQLAAMAGDGVTQGIIAALEVRDSKVSKYVVPIAAALGVSIDILIQGVSEEDFWSMSLGHNRPDDIYHKNAIEKEEDSFDFWGKKPSNEQNLLSIKDTYKGLNNEKSEVNHEKSNATVLEKAKTEQSRAPDSQSEIQEQVIVLLAKLTEKQQLDLLTKLKEIAKENDSLLLDLLKRRS